VGFRLARPGRVRPGGRSGRTASAGRVPHRYAAVRRL